MNDRLKPWFCGTILFSVISAAIAVLTVVSSPNDFSYGASSFLMMPVITWSLIINIWCVLGFIGSALEIKKRSDTILPTVLAVLPVIFIILLFFMNDIGSGGFLEGIGLFMWLINFGFFTVIFIVWIMILKAARAHNYDIPEENKVCFERFKTAYKAAFLLFAAVPFVILLGVTAYPLKCEADARLQKAKDQNAAAEYMQSADETITYQNSGDLYGKDILSTKLMQNSVLIAYAENRVTFVYRDRYNKEKLKTYILEPRTDIPKGELQYICDLNAPGKELKTYCDNTAYPNHTTFLTVEMRDGTFLYADTGGEYLGFEYSPNVEIVKALENADEVIEYGENLPEDGAQFPPYSMGVTHNTFCMDHKTMTGSVIYCSGGKTWEQAGYSSPYGEVHVCDLEFEPFDGNICELVPQAVVPLSKPDEYIIPYHIYYGEQWGRCMGILLHTADGWYNSDDGWHFDFDKCGYSMTNEESMHYLFEEYFNQLRKSHASKAGVLT